MITTIDQNSNVVFQDLIGSPIQVQLETPPIVLTQRPLEETEVNKRTGASVVINTALSRSAELIEKVMQSVDNRPSAQKTMGVEIRPNADTTTNAITKQSGFNWLWLLLAPISYFIYKKFIKK